MANRTQRVGDIEVDEDTLYLAIEEANKVEAAAGRGRVRTGIVLLVFCGAAAWFGQHLSGGAAVTLAVAIIAIGVVLALMLPMLIDPQGRQRRLRTALNRRGLNLCVNCGYDLRGLGDDVKQCPECGTERVPMPQSSEDVAV